MTDPFTQIQTALADTLANDTELSALIATGNFLRFDSESYDDAEEESLLSADGPRLVVEQGGTEFNSTVTSSSFAFRHTLQIMLASQKVSTPEINTLRWIVYKAIERARRTGAATTIFGLAFVRRVTLSTPSQEAVGNVDPSSGAATERGRTCVMEVSVEAFFALSELQ